MAYNKDKDQTAGYISPEANELLSKLSVAQKRTKRATLELLIEQASKELAK